MFWRSEPEHPVDIVVYGKKRKRWSWGWWGKKKHKKNVLAVATDVHLGDTITVDAGHGGKHKIGSEITIRITTGNGVHEFLELDKFHTSCSQPLGPGNQFGSMLITALTSTQGGTVGERRRGRRGMLDFHRHRSGTAL